MTVQEELRKRRPHLFDDSYYVNVESNEWRDDERWNDPVFRQLTVIASIQGKIHGPQSYWMLHYCKKEGEPFVRATNEFFDFMIKDVPRPLAVRQYEAAVKIRNFMKKISIKSPIHFIRLQFAMIGCLSLMGTLFTFSPIFLILSGASGTGYYCLKNK